jgi:uncharacterized protein (DUF1330 family)
MSKEDNDGPFYMLNALWFTEGGAETYRQYIREAGPIIAEVGGKPATPGFVPERALIGEFDADLVFVVEYPSWASFQALLEHEKYQEIRHLREEAITKSLLIRCGKARLG